MFSLEIFLLFVFTSCPGEVTTLAGSVTIGNTDGIGVAASFGGPSGVAVDANCVLFVADYDNNQIRRISTSGELVAPTR